MGTSTRVLGGLCLLLATSSLHAQVNTEISFQCDMSVQIALGAFDPASGQVVVRGELNVWGCSDPMTDPDGDGVYEVVLTRDGLLPGTYPYKFNINCANVWEDGANRGYVVDGTAPDTNADGFGEITVLRFFNDVSPEDILFSDVTVIFSVNVSPVRRALDAQKPIAPVQDHGAPITDFSEVTSVGVTGPWSGWNWTQFTPENLMVDDGGLRRSRGRPQLYGLLPLRDGLKQEPCLQVLPERLRQRGRGWE